MNEHIKNKIRQLVGEIARLKNQITSLGNENKQLISTNKKLDAEKKQYKALIANVSKGKQQLISSRGSIMSSQGTFEKGYSSESAQNISLKFVSLTANVEQIIRHLAIMEPEANEQINLLDIDIKKNEQMIKTNKQKIQKLDEKLKAKEKEKNKLKQSL